MYYENSDNHPNFGSEEYRILGGEYAWKGKPEKSGNYVLLDRKAGSVGNSSVFKYVFYDAEEQRAKDLISDIEIELPKWYTHERWVFSEYSTYPLWFGPFDFPTNPKQSIWSEELPTKEGYFWLRCINYDDCEKFFKVILVFKVDGCEELATHSICTENFPFQTLSSLVKTLKEKGDGSIKFAPCSPPE